AFGSGAPGRSPVPRHAARPASTAGAGRPGRVGTLPVERTLRDRPAQDELPALLATLRAHVDYQRQLGVIGYPPAPRPVPARPAPPTPAPAPRRPSAPVQTANLFTEPGVAPADSLEALRAAIRDCQRCKLAPPPTHLVVGVCAPPARPGCR